MNVQKHLARIAGMGNGRRSGGRSFAGVPVIHAHAHARVDCREVEPFTFRVLDTRGVHLELFARCRKLRFTGVFC